MPSIMMRPLTFASRMAPRCIPRTTPSPACRLFSQTSSKPMPRKGFEDKDSINTDATEYSKSGTDDTAAHQDDAAYDPSSTKPDDALNMAREGKEGEGNPLEVSPANSEVSKQRDPTEGGAERSPGPSDTSGEKGSGQGQTNKGKKV